MGSLGACRRGWGSPPPAAVAAAAATETSSFAQLQAMGFGDDEARQSLAEHAWDVNKAMAPAGDV